METQKTQQEINAEVKAKIDALWEQYEAIDEYDHSVDWNTRWERGLQKKEIRHQIFWLGWNRDNQAPDHNGRTRWEMLMYN